MKTNKKYYLIWVFGCCDPNLYGPYKTTKERDKEAKKIFKENGDQHTYLPAEVNASGKLVVGSYTNSFFEK